MHASRFLCVALALVAALTNSGIQVRADSAPMWESPEGLSPGVADSTVRMADEQVEVQVVERDGAAVAVVTATFDLANDGPATHMLVGFPNFAAEATVGGGYDPGMFTPANLTNFRAWTDTTTFTPVEQRVAVTPSAKQYGGSDWFVWNMTFPRGAAVPVHVAYEDRLGALPPPHPGDSRGWFHVSYVLRTGALWAGSIGHVHVTFKTPDGGFVGAGAPTEMVGYPSVDNAAKPTSITDNQIEWDYTNLEPTFDVGTTYVFSETWRRLRADETAMQQPEAQPSESLQAAQDAIGLLGIFGPYAQPAAVVDRFAAPMRQWAWQASALGTADSWEAVGDVERYFAAPPYKSQGLLACWPDDGIAAYQRAADLGSTTAAQKLNDLAHMSDYMDQANIQRPAPCATYSPAATQSVTTDDFTPFVGDWLGHGRELRVAPDGTASLDYRTYRVCGQDGPPCDRIVGNAIMDGGHVNIRLQSASSTRATGTVTSSVDPLYPTDAQVVLTLDPQGAVDIEIDDQPFGNVCGEDAPVGYCGA